MVRKMVRTGVTAPAPVEQGDIVASAKPVYVRMHVYAA
jgi:hypothetical protein